LLINLNDAEVKFALYSIREMATKLEAKLTSEAKISAIIDLLNPVTAAPGKGTIRLTKAGRPAKKPGRKPGKKAVKITPVEQAA
jgi:hypothetical protein